MDKERALQLLKGGYDSVQRWNRWRKNHSELPDLGHTDFTDADLADASPSGSLLKARKDVQDQWQTEEHIV